MDTESTIPHTLDLAGLPEPVVEEVTRIVSNARRQQPSAPVASLHGIFAHLGVETPTLEEFERARREMWADFPRDFPDVSE